jgi:hypothetical protein
MMGNRLSVEWSTSLAQARVAGQDQAEDGDEQQEQREDGPESGQLGQAADQTPALSSPYFFITA